MLHKQHQTPFRFRLSCSETPPPAASYQSPHHFPTLHFSVWAGCVHADAVWWSVFLLSQLSLAQVALLFIWHLPVRLTPSSALQHKGKRCHCLPYLRPHAPSWWGDLLLGIRSGKNPEEGRMFATLGLQPCSHTFAFGCILWDNRQEMVSGGSTSGWEETVDHICHRSCLCFHLNMEETDFA